MNDSATQNADEGWQRRIAGRRIGSIEVRGATLDRVDLRTASESIELSARLSARARKDPQRQRRLRLPVDTAAHFEVDSFSGGIQNAFGPNGRRTSRYGPGQRLDFQAGQGGAEVMIDTFSGSVNIEHSSSAGE